MATTVAAAARTHYTVGDGVESFGDFTVGAGTTARDALQAAIDALPDGVVTVTINSTGTSTSIRVNTTAVGGSSLTVATDIGGLTSTVAASLAANFNAAGNCTTWFRVSSVANVVYFRPRFTYSVMRKITFQRVSGTSATYTNSDGSTITASVAFKPVPMGGTIRVGRGIYDGVTGSPAIMVVDTPGVSIRCDPGVVWRASVNGMLEVYSSRFELEKAEVIWESSDSRHNKWLILMEGSEWTLRDVTLDIDSIGSSGSGLVCWGLVFLSVSGLVGPPPAVSLDYRRGTIDNCNFYLGNRTYGVWAQSVFQLDVNKCLFTSQGARHAPAGQLGAALQECPYYAALIIDSDHVNWTDNDVVNFGGHSDADNTDALVKFIRLSAGFNLVSETGHTLIQGGRFHGNRNHVAADIYANKAWFFRVEGVEFHRHLVATSHSPAHDYWKVACILIEDVVQAQIDTCEFFNLGQEGTPNVNYPAIGVLSLTDPVGESSGVQTKIISVTNCTYDNKVVTDVTLPAASITDHHPFFQYYNTNNGHRYEQVNITGNTMIGGMRSTARFKINAPGDPPTQTLAVGEGLEVFIPANAFGTGFPSSNQTITCVRGTHFTLQATAHATAQQIAVFLNAHAQFKLYFYAEVNEPVYQLSPAVSDPVGSTILIRALEFSTRGNSCTIKHISSVAGSTTCTVGNSPPTTVAEGATTALAGGFGQLGSGPIAIVLQGDGLAALGSTSPKHVHVSGNSIAGFALPYIIDTVTVGNDPIGPLTFNSTTFNDDNDVAPFIDS